MTQEAVSIASFDTGYSADSTEFCPISSHSRYLTCGTYQLTDEQQENVRVRKGKIYLFDMNKSSALDPEQVIETPAVLDMKWSHSPIQDKPTLGVVDAMGGFRLYGFEQDKLISTGHVQATDDPSILCLSLDWANRVNKDDCRVVTSHSDGQLSILAPEQGGEYATISQWQGHDLEAWIAAFNYWNTNIIYSGADDGLFKGWDTRMPEIPTFTYKRHLMGVTTMQSSPHKEHVLATGSYDEHVYFWDTRSMRAPVNSFQTPGGGIWRLKWHPTRDNLLLSASMHAGAFVLDVNNETSFDTQLKTSFLDHKSMAYGADWSFEDPDLIASCSFYDHIMHLWKSN
ncbi:WD40 repeat-like protein [Backusella circina FSU 941]|nr:WD40 repeat-like protein [Backusella circina FSU 941]